MERDEIIKRIDIITRGLSQPNNETDESSEIAHILRMFQPDLKLTYSLYLCGQPYCLSS
jgi:hypothetical protein